MDLQAFQLRMQLNEELLDKFVKSDFMQNRDPVFTRKLERICERHADIALAEYILDHTKNFGFEILRNPKSTNVLYSVNKRDVPERIWNHLSARVITTSNWFHRLEMCYTFDSMGNNLQTIPLLDRNASDRFTINLLSLEPPTRLGRNHVLIERVKQLYYGIIETVYNIVNSDGVTIHNGVRYTDNTQEIMNASNGIITGTNLVDSEGQHPEQVLGYKCVIPLPINKNIEYAVATLIIPPNAKYTNGDFAPTCKVRTDRAIVKDIRIIRPHPDARMSECNSNIVYLCESIPSAVSIHDKNFVYTRGSEVQVENYDPSLSVTCGSGIHFYWCLESAVQYPQPSVNLTVQVRHRRFGDCIWSLYSTAERNSIRTSVMLLLQRLPTELVLTIMDLAY